MANIKISIELGNNETRTYENEDILQLSSRTRSVSDANVPIFNAFSSLGTIVIKDKDLSIYKDAQDGKWDNYKYYVNLFLNDSQIAQHTISERPQYNYSDKTLTLQLSNDLDILDTLTYSGYEYPLTSQTLDLIFKDMVTKAFGITDFSFMGEESDPNSFISLFKGITIPYPYLSSKKYREAISNVLTMAKCGLVLNTEGKLKLVRLDKTRSNVSDSDIIVIKAEHISSPFIPTVILDNKYDDVEVQANKVDYIYQYNTTVYESKISSTELENCTKEDWTYDTKDFNSTITTIDFGTKEEIEIPSDGNNIGYITNWDEYTYLSVGAKLDVSSRLYSLPPLKIPKNTSSNLIEIVKAYPLQSLSYYMTVKVSKIGKKGDSTITLTGLNSFELNPQSNFDEETKKEETLNNFSPLTGNSYSTNYDESNLYYTNIKIEYSIPQEKFFVPGIIEINNDGYTLKDCKVSPYFVERFYYLKSNESVVEIYDYPTALIETIYEPLELYVKIPGDYKELVFNLQSIQALENSKNITELSTYGELLQYTGEITENSAPINEIYKIKKYYEKGIHSANLTVIGGKNYYNKDGELKRTKPFEMGDVLDIKDYNNNSALNYTSFSNYPIVWQVVDNEISFEGGAVFQALTVKELPLEIEDMKFELNSSGTAYNLISYNNPYVTLVTIPNKYKGIFVEAISENAFKETNVKEVIIPNSIQTIGISAFQDCISLNKISIGNGVTKIGNSAFKGCTNLTEITYSDSYNVWISSKIDKGTLETDLSQDNYILICTDGIYTGNYKLTKASGNNNYCIKPKDGVVFEGTLEIPAKIGNYNITEISGFSTQKITTLKIPNSVTSIGNSAFNNCLLTSIQLGNSVTNIGEFAFASNNITEIELPNSVTTIGEYAFFSCQYLETITIGQNVTTLLENSFDGCINLEEIAFGGTKEQWDNLIGKRPNNCIVTCSDGDYEITKLDEVEIYGSVTEESDFDINEIGYITSANTYNKAVLVIPKSVNGITVLGIDESFFDGNKNNFVNTIEKIYIPSTIQYIGRYAFRNMPELKEVYFTTYNNNSEIMEILMRTFENCPKLSDVWLPLTIKRIERYAFYKDFIDDYVDITFHYGGEDFDTEVSKETNFARPSGWYWDNFTNDEESGQDYPVDRVVKTNENI